MLLKKFTITDDLIKQRLDKTLVKLLPDYSRAQIQRWIKAGYVKVNQQIVKVSDTKLKEGALISLEAKIEPLLQSHKPEKLPLNIVFEDEALIVVNKPVGLVVHPGAGNIKHTLMNALLYHCPALNQLPRAGLIHRLDKDTSGLLLVAKTPQSYQYLVNALKERTIHREYRAIVKGLMIAGGKIDAPIGRHVRYRTQMAVKETGGKTAITHYRVLKKFQAHTYLAIKLDTGRTHQIRVHLMHIHHPVLGDQTYGKHIHPKGHLSEKVLQAIRSFKRQALHAYQLKLKHPTTQKDLTFEAPVPDDMQSLLHALCE
jgi:23S rRNA pseudouridine1911/1915/1917 synthase